VKPGFNTRDETNPERVEFKCVNMENMGKGVKRGKGYGVREIRETRLRFSARHRLSFAGRGKGIWV
jgi:hypothetical protein